MDDNKIQSVQTEVNQVKTIMQDNIETIVVNCAELESLNDKTNQLSESGKTFKKNAKKLKNEERKKAYKKTCMVVGLGSLCVVAVLTPILAPLFL